MADIASHVHRVVRRPAEEPNQRAQTQSANTGINRQAARSALLSPRLRQRLQAHAAFIDTNAVTESHIHPLRAQRRSPRGNGNR